MEDQWAVTMFSFTRELMARNVRPTDLLVRARKADLGSAFEIDGFQHFATLPDVDECETAAFRRAVDENGVRLTQLGIYDDLFVNPKRRADVTARVAYLERQIASAAHLGFRTAKIAWGVDLDVLDGLRPCLDRFGVTLTQEAQGSIRADSADLARRVAMALRFPDNFGFVFDLSACMYGLPITYLEDLRRRGVPAAAVRLLADEWPSSGQAIRDRVFDAAGAVSPEARLRLSMPFGRFGNSLVAEFRDFLRLVDIVHLKFWDLEDQDGIVSFPMRDLAGELTRIGFQGPITSEWGGHEWLSMEDADATTMTRSHRKLFRRSLLAE
ncbi:MAG: hypothetical protein ACTHNQ_15465 [Microbacterium sp.]|uniref:hypothetical protein n=1 Tax=Microbacterium sp. TaxID=51671 RepID=UPI003F801E68